MSKTDTVEKEISIKVAAAVIIIVLGILLSAGYLVGLEFFWKPVTPPDPYAYEISMAEQKVKADPKNIKNQLLLSYAYLRKGDGASSLKVLKEAEKQEPKNKQIAYNLGLSYLSIKDYQQAIKYLEPQVKGGIIDFDLNYNLGRAYLESKQYSKAVERLISCTIIEPGAADAYLLLSEAYLGQGDKVNATKSVNKALKLVPEYPEAKKLLAKINGGK